MGNKILKGERVALKPLEYEDALEIRKWGIHENKLFIDYNLAELSATELHYWYIIKKKSLRKEGNEKWLSKLHWPEIRTAEKQHCLTH